MYSEVLVLEDEVFNDIRSTELIKVIFEGSNLFIVLTKEVHVFEKNNNFSIKNLVHSFLLPDVWFVG